MRMSSVVALALALTTACGDDPSSSTPAECNPLGTTGCVLPWPSAIYERADPDSPTGVRLDLPEGALPANDAGSEIDPAWINQRTGFSPMTQILLTFPGGVDDTNLVFADDFAASLTDASPTVIVNMTTGERVAHFAEVDANETTNLDEQILYLRPAVRLAGNTRYAVGIRKSLRGKAGPLEVPAAFQALMKGESTGHARLDATRHRYPALLDALDAAGAPREDLVLAFDFQVADDDALIADPLAARDAAMAIVGDAEEVEYTVTATTPGTDGIARVVHLDYTTPQVATSDGFHRDGAGEVTVMGTTTAQASIVIPACATPANRAGIVIYGHGFFGGLTESTGQYIRQFAEATCNVVVGGVWRGMSKDEIPNALLALGDFNQVQGFGEHIWQGMVDFMTLTRLAKGKLARELLVEDPEAATPVSIVDPAQLAFYGISQGHILGSTLFAYDQILTRAALGVGGANWAVLFERSNNWSVYGLPIKSAYGGVMSSVILQQVLEMALEPVDGGTIAPRALAGGVPGTPPKQYLLHMSMGDCAVPNLASEYQARSLGLPLLSPSVKEPYGLTPMPGPLDSAFVIMDESPSPLPPVTNEEFAYDNEAHENLRRRRATLEQIDQFFETGVIENFCDGACDCAAGQCGPLP